MRFELISSMTIDRSIGLQGMLLHRFREDMKFFREETTRKVDDFDQTTKEGKPNTLIVGRETYNGMLAAAEKLPMLPGRNIIVVTHKKDPLPDTTALSLEEAYRRGLDFGSKRIFVIGGQSLFKQALPYTTRIYLTKIFSNPRGDRFFPEFEDDFIEEPPRKEFLSENGIEFHICTYKRKMAADSMI